jgi:hypothetical protein
MREDDDRDEAFDALLRDAARTYNSPPERADDDATWAAIEGRLPEATTPTLVVLRGTRTGPSRPWRLLAHPWTRMAAMLLVGVALGRLTSGSSAPLVGMPAGDTPVAVGGSGPVAPAVVETAMQEYLSRTEALLAGLPDELRAGGADAAFVSQADGLLLRTRLLLDSPAATDPSLRALLDDLEVVLAQVVRLDAARDQMEVDFLHQAMEQRDVLPRLREAVVDRSAD